MCARIKFEFGATIFEVNDDLITLFVYKILHSDSDLKLDFNIEIKPTVHRFKICIWRNKPTVLDAYLLNIYINNTKVAKSCSVKVGKIQ